MKYAVYVEGKAELLFVADVLSKYSDYDQSFIGFNCITLNADEYKFLGYPTQGNEKESTHFYQIVNVNNDGLVISKLKKDIPNLIRQGFEIIIGLRDVFGRDYQDLIDNQIIDNDLIRLMYEKQFNLLKVDGKDIRLHYAIMEYETWMMALMEKFILSNGGNVIEIFKNIGIHPKDDFEQTVYHPYNKIQEIYRAIHKRYGKHEHDYLSFLSSIELDDYETLRNSNRCISFKNFIDSLLP